MLFLPSWSLLLSSLRHTNVDEWSSYGKQSEIVGTAAAGQQAGHAHERTVDNIVSGGVGGGGGMIGVAACLRRLPLSTTQASVQFLTISTPVVAAPTINSKSVLHPPRLILLVSLHTACNQLLSYTPIPSTMYPYVCTYHVLRSSLSPKYNRVLKGPTLHPFETERRVVHFSFLIVLFFLFLVLRKTKNEEIGAS